MIQLHIFSICNAAMNSFNLVSVGGSFLTSTSTGFHINKSVIIGDFIQLGNKVLTKVAIRVWF